MINLLKESDKKIVRAEFYRRVFNSYGLAVAILLLISLVAVSAYFVQLRFENNTLSELVKKQRGDANAAGTANYEADLARANKIINSLSSDIANPHFATLLIENVLSSRAAGIKLNAIDLSKPEGGKWLLKLNGVSSSRKEMLAFTENLKKNPLFTEVDSPFSNLIKEADSNFAITLTLSPKINDPR